MRKYSAYAAALIALTAAFAADPPPQVQVALAVLQAGSMGRFKASELAKTSLPKPGNRLQVRVAATGPCHAMIVAFDSAGNVAYPDQPVIVALEANSQQQIPAAGGWKWEDPGAISELEVLLVDNRSPALDGLTRLIKAMHDQAAPAVRTRQVSELRRLTDSLTQRDAASADYSVKSEPVPLAGLLRGDVCEWCKDAQKISVPPAGSYLVRHRFP
jgi:hypothetical protein